MQCAVYVQSEYKGAVEHGAAANCLSIKTSNMKYPHEHMS